MAGIERKTFEEPDDTIELVHGVMRFVKIGDEEVWRSEFTPGWNWDEDMKELAEGATSCPMTHREYVIAGRIHYEMDDGTELTGQPGDFLFIHPGHRAAVVGDETCVLLDWQNEEPSQEGPEAGA
jgi:hypothetical protein